MSDEESDVDKQENTQKRVAHYQTLLAAWFESRMELDKQLLILSTAAIGFLMFFYEKIESTEKYFCLLFAGLLIAGILFIVTIAMILRTLHINPSYIKYVLEQNDAKKLEEEKYNKKLERLMLGYFITFTLAVFLTFMVAVLKLIS